MIPGGPVEASVRLKPTTEYEPKEVIGELSLKDVFAHPIGKQVVPHWLKVKGDRDVPAAYLPHAVAGSMMPADAACDQLGLIEALKIMQVASETALARLAYVSDASPAAIAEWAKNAVAQCTRLLERVRREQLKRLDGEIKRIEKSYAHDVQQEPPVPEHKLNANPEYRQLPQLKFEAQRLAKLLSNAETHPEKEIK